MLTDFEKKELATLLSALPTKTLMSLTDTVSAKVVQVLDREEAISAIICYSETPEQLLKRKKILKIHLLKYLHDKGQPTPPHFEKQDLIHKILGLWSSVDEPAGSSSQSAGQQAPGRASGGEECQPSLEYTLATQFITWYMSKWHCASLVNEDMYDDCALKLYFTSDQTADKMEMFSGATLAAQRLNHLVAAEALVFGMSELSKVEAVSDDHGLFIVAFAGTVHQCAGSGNKLVGIFEQRCGLARHPAKGSYLVKFIDLIIRSQPGGEGSSNRLM